MKAVSSIPNFSKYAALNYSLTSQFITCKMIVWIFGAKLFMKSVYLKIIEIIKVDYEGIRASIPVPQF